MSHAASSMANNCTAYKMTGSSDPELLHQRENRVSGTGVPVCTLSLREPSSAGKGLAFSVSNYFPQGNTQTGTSSHP